MVIRTQRLVALDMAVTRSLIIGQGEGLKLWHEGRMADAHKSPLRQVFRLS